MRGAREIDERRRHATDTIRARRSSATKQVSLVKQAATLTYSSGGFDCNRTINDATVGDLMR